MNWEDPAPSGIWNVLIKSFDEDFDNVTKLNKLDWILDNDNNVEFMISFDDGMLFGFIYDDNDNMMVLMMIIMIMTLAMKS